MTPSPGSRLIVGLSGGVDSAVAAALLCDQGYDVVGVMLRLWSEGETVNRCCAPEAQNQARQVASQLEIPFYVIDAQEAFYEMVVQPFIDSYGRGDTPNPCLLCNRQIRWDFLISRARAFAGSGIATGHYARILQGADGTYQLLKSLDSRKDQSYFLHMLTQEQLSQTLFPLGGLDKTTVRRLARDFQLPVADRPDSQDLCFVGEADYRRFLRDRNPEMFRPGAILDPEGRVLGQHEGLAQYTIGQRKGLGLSSPEPYYVLAKNPADNSLVVGRREELGRTEFRAGPLHWISGQPPSATFRTAVRIRYQSREIPAEVQVEQDLASIQLAEPLPDITPGQAAVFYQGDLCLGGGAILREEK